MTPKEKAAATKTTPKTGPKRGRNEEVTLTRKELHLVDWIVAYADEKVSNVEVQTWTQATDNVRKSPNDISIDPELQSALASAVISLKSVPAPTLNQLLRLWQGATAFAAQQRRGKSKTT